MRALLIALAAFSSAACLDLRPESYDFATGHGAGGGCGCDTAPPGECLDPFTVRVFEPSGTCDTGSCHYASSVTSCAMGCEAGRCKADPCVGQTCNMPPAASCVSAGTLRTYTAAGQCDADAQCSYGAVDVGCVGGCSAGHCAAASCSGVTCGAAPAATCIGQTTLRAYSGAGACLDGVCNYAFSDTRCPFGCAEAACSPDPCANVTCGAPPGPTCFGSAERHFSGSGMCFNGTCQFAATDTPCANGCVAGECVAGGTGGGGSGAGGGAAGGEGGGAAGGSNGGGTSAGGGSSSGGGSAGGVSAGGGSAGGGSAGGTSAGGGSAGGSSTGGGGTGGSGTEAFACADGADNDGDNAIDCADSDCTGRPACQGLADGKACTLDAQCAGGKCFSEAGTGYPNGYCTNVLPCTVGSATGCNGGYCMERAGRATCMAKCSGSVILGTAYCRTGYECAVPYDFLLGAISYCVPMCASDADCATSGGGRGCNVQSKRCEALSLGLVPYGGACTAGTQCESGRCYTGTDYPNGACIGPCSATVPCGPTGACFNENDVIDSIGSCTLRCTSSSQCRQSEGYQCRPANTAGNGCLTCQPKDTRCSYSSQCCSGHCVGNADGYFCD